MVFQFMSDEFDFVSCVGGNLDNHLLITDFVRVE